MPITSSSVGRRPRRRTCPLVQAPRRSRPWRYVPVLAREPGARWHAVPGLGSAIGDGAVPAQIEAAHDGDRRMVAILAAVLSDGLDAVEVACKSIDQNVSSASSSISWRGGADPAPPSSSPRTPLHLQHDRRPTAPLRQPQEGELMERPGSRSYADAQALWHAQHLQQGHRDGINASAEHRRSSAISPRSPRSRARSIDASFIAKLPLAKDVEEFDFDGTRVDEVLVRRTLPTAPSSPISATPSSSAAQEPAGGRLAIAIAGLRPQRLACAASSTSSIWSINEDPAPRSQARPHRRLPSPARLVQYSTSSAIFHFAQPSAVAAPSDQPLYERTSIIVTADLAFRQMARRLRRPRDDHRAARPSHPCTARSSNRNDPARYCDRA